MVLLLLVEEAKCLAEEIRIEKLNEKWASIPHEQLLNQSFTDQLNSTQILEQLAPLQLAKEHLPVDTVDILEHLGKADNIPFNQLYYIAENCVDRYYTKVIETFVSVRCNFAVHCSVTPFIIQQPIQRPHLLERVYKPMCSSH